MNEWSRQPALARRPLQRVASFPPVSPACLLLIPVRQRATQICNRTLLRNAKEVNGMAYISLQPPILVARSIRVHFWLFVQSGERLK